ncbi:Arsenite-antimonite (ArsAB) efflux family [Planktothrix serta PCC 8927]|uniref:Arsenite-antimonite (ArsAB) efflux family n=1 Tax=Planktothrix serta PCC 8927 TaxID=671068 RepID=A0A7Z9DZX5_9CYAN|nr:TRC40/GET3/ArsA family transport-energizing ATPase [Planktothrix serta]VXD20514.1 Arsenite-antimonite (ArsAB) efflux family [Planktothrix serta PCC 8927]
MFNFNTFSLVLFSGKGGVGKTTLSCGFALQWAKEFPHEQILLLSTDPAHSLGDVLQIKVTDQAENVGNLPNLKVRALDAETLLTAFKARYGSVLELLVERGSFVEGEDLTPVWDLDWPGIDELMGLLEIQRLFHDKVVDRIVVDMAPSGHALNLLELMDFLDNLLASLTLFQEKHHTISQSFTGRYQPDQADEFLAEMQDQLATGRSQLQDQEKTACFVVAIPEPMSWLETGRFLDALKGLNIPVGGLLINHLVSESQNLDRYQEQQKLLQQFQDIAEDHPIYTIPELPTEPLGTDALKTLFSKLEILTVSEKSDQPFIPTQPLEFPSFLAKFSDFIAENRRLIIVGGKGGVGKTTVAAAIGWEMAQQYPQRKIQMVSIDPAHSLGDAFGLKLNHQPIAITENLFGQEIDSTEVLNQFREDYLWELAEMMSGDKNDPNATLQLAYGPEAWRRIVSQSLPGIDEMLSLVEVMDLLESHELDLIILDTAPTGHLLRFLEMPTAMSEWLAWIFKLWIKYQDVLGRTEFMGRLRTLRQRVVKAQKKLQDPNYTEFIGVVQAQVAIVAEAERLTASLTEKGISQRYIVQNRFEAGQEFVTGKFPNQTLVILPTLPRSVEPIVRIKEAAKMLFYSRE